MSSASENAPDVATDGEPSLLAPPSEAWSGALIGAVINDRYRVLERIAVGGMGVVYKAEQISLGRIVALKVLRGADAGGGGGGDDAQFRSRFFLEAAAVAMLVHPNTVVVFDYGAHGDELLYIAMEYLDGPTLHQVVSRSGPLPAARALRISLQICATLGEAHAAGLVHRDVKPGNVMLVARGSETDFVKVMDFGLVKVLADGGDELTHNGIMLGSPRYMSPEQIQCAAVDQRSDIYSFGALLHHMLTGRAPFVHSSSFVVMTAHIHQAPQSLRATHPGCDASARLEALVMRCLAKSPADRFQSMEEVIAEIYACADELDFSSSVLALRSGAFASRVGGPFQPPALPPSDAQTQGATVTRGPPPLPTRRPARGTVRLTQRAFLALTAALGMSVATVVGAAALWQRSERGRPRAGASSGAVAPGAIAAAQRQPTGAAAPATATPRVLRLVTEPPGAHAQRNGQDIGDTPLSLVVPAGEAWVVELSAPGHRARTVTLTAAQDEVHARLEPAPADDARAARRAIAPQPRARATTATAGTAAVTAAPRTPIRGPARDWSERSASDNRNPWAE